MFDFKKIDFGPNEAKGDSNLANYFLQIPDYTLALEGKKRYVIGRKGTGKTALLERIRLDAKAKPNSNFVKDLSLQDFPLNDLRGLRDKGLQDKSQYVPIWSFCILVELSKLIIADNNASNEYIKSEIRDFLTDNHLLKSNGFTETVSVLTQREAKLNVKVGWFELNAGIGDNKTSQITTHYTKIVEPLVQILEKVQSSTKYFLLFDELDEGYNVGDTNKRLLLLSLFRSVENLYLIFKNKKLDFIPILALRSDIFDSLADNDLNKIDDYIIRLNWQADSMQNYSLRELVNARIRFCYPSIKSDDPWHDVVLDKNASIPGPKKSIWRYMQTRTFERPRDIIKCLKYCNSISFSGHLTFSQVVKAEYQYSDWLYREIRDEIQSHLPVWQEAMACLTKVGRGVLTKDILAAKINDDSALKSYMSSNSKNAEDIMSKLFEFSIIGNLDENDRWLFKYKDSDLPWNDTRRLCVHFGVQKKLRIS